MNQLTNEEKAQQQQLWNSLYNWLDSEIKTYGKDNFALPHEHPIRDTLLQELQSKYMLTIKQSNLPVQ